MSRLGEMKEMSGNRKHGTEKGGSMMTEKAYRACGCVFLALVGVGIVAMGWSFYLDSQRVEVELKGALAGQIAAKRAEFAKESASQGKVWFWQRTDRLQEIVAERDEILEEAGLYCSGGWYAGGGYARFLCDYYRRE